MAALAVAPLLGLVDTALVGRLGGSALAALGIDMAVFAAVFWIFSFLTYGTTAEVARLRGAGRPDEATRHARAALWLAIGLGALVTALQPTVVVVFVLDGILLGAGDLRFLLVTTGAAALAGLAPVALLALTLGWGLAGIWAGMAALMAVRLATTVPRLLGGRWLVVPAPAQPVTT